MTNKFSILLSATTLLLTANGVYAEENPIQNDHGKKEAQLPAEGSTQDSNKENNNREKKRQPSPDSTDERNPNNNGPHDISALQALNERISGLSIQIVEHQEGLATELQELLDQRRSVIDLEQGVMQMIADQETKLDTQHKAIQEAEERLDEQKEIFAEQSRILNELIASLKPRSGLEATPDKTEVKAEVKGTFINNGEQNIMQE